MYRSGKAFFFVFLLLSGEIHAKRTVELVDGAGHIGKSQMTNRSEGTAENMTKSASLAKGSGLSSIAEIGRHSEEGPGFNPGWLEKLGYYGALSKERQAFLRSKVTDEMISTALVYSLCVRVAPAGGYRLKGYGPNAHFELRCSENYQMVGGPANWDQLDIAGTPFVKPGKKGGKAIKKSEDEKSWVKTHFDNWDEAHQIFPRRLSIKPNSSQPSWPPYTPKMQNRFMICFGDVFETRLWEDCTGFWNFQKFMKLTSNLFNKLNKKNPNRLLDEIRAKALYPGPTSMDPIKVAQHTKKELGVADMVVPLVRKALDQAKIQIKTSEAKELGLDVQPLTRYTSQADVEGMAPPYKSRKNLVEMLEELTGKESTVVSISWDCIAPKENAIGACEVLCNSMDGCMGFNFHAEDNACCFLGKPDQEMQSKEAPGITLYLPPAPAKEASLLETDPATVAVACFAPQAGGTAATVGGVVIFGTTIPFALIAVVGIIVGVVSFKLLSRWVSKKKLASKLKKFHKLMSPEYSIVIIGAPIQYKNPILPADHIPNEVTQANEADEADE